MTANLPNISTETIVLIFVIGRSDVLNPIHRIFNLVSMHVVDDDVKRKENGLEKYKFKNHEVSLTYKLILNYHILIRKNTKQHIKRYKDKKNTTWIKSFN